MKFLKFLFALNIITLYVNLKYFKFFDAIKFPILVFGKVCIYSLKGEIEYTGNISTGIIRIGTSHIGIFDKKVRTILNIHGRIIFDGKANIGRGSSISIGRKSILQIGNNFTITGRSSIICSGERNIYIGNNNLLSWDILIMNTDFHEIFDKTSKAVLNIPQNINIGNNVWIGCNTKILKGGNIADNCVIGANSIVTKTIKDSNAVYVGNPLKKVKENISWTY